MPPKPALAEEPVVDTRPQGGCGKFFYHNGATYEGDYKFIYSTPPPPPEGTPAKGKKPAKDEPPPPPPEPPKRVRHGKGLYKEGDYVFEGEFQEDKMHGTGKFAYASGACYEGEWVDNKYQGKGRFSWPDGRSYEGEWQDNKMHGQGVYTDVNGHKWEGQFFNGSGPGLTCQL